MNEKVALDTTPRHATTIQWCALEDLGNNKKAQPFVKSDQPNYIRLMLSVFIPTKYYAADFSIFLFQVISVL